MKEFKTTEIKLVGAFFLVAGLFGFVTFLGVIFPLNELGKLLYILPAVLFGLAVYSGYLLLIKENIKGIEIARAVIALQMIQFHIAGLGYLFVTGAFLFVGFENANLGFNFGLESVFSVTLSEDTSNVVLRINILAVGIFFYLTKTLNKFYDDQEIRDAIEAQKHEERKEGER